MTYKEYIALGAEAIKNQLIMAGVQTGAVKFHRTCIHIYTTDNKECVTIYHGQVLMSEVYEFSIQTTSFGAVDPFDDNSEAEMMKIMGALFSNRTLTLAIKDICQKLDNKELEKN